MLEKVKGGFAWKCTYLITSLKTLLRLRGQIGHFEMKIQIRFLCAT